MNAVSMKTLATGILFNKVLMMSDSCSFLFQVPDSVEFSDVAKRLEELWPDVSGIKKLEETWIRTHDHRYKDGDGWFVLSISELCISESWDILQSLCKEFGLSFDVDHGSIRKV